MGEDSLHAVTWGVFPGKEYKKPPHPVSLAVNVFGWLTAGSHFLKDYYSDYHRRGFFQSLERRSLQYLVRMGPCLSLAHSIVETRVRYYAKLLFGQYYTSWISGTGCFVELS